MEPGLYNDKNKLICSWDELIEKYNLDIESNFFRKSPDAINQFESGTKLIVGETYTIGSYALSGCKYLKYIELPDTIEKINDHAFDGCSKLNKIVLSDNITKIGHRAFATCYELVDIKLPLKLEQLDSISLAFTNIDKIMLPPNLKEIRYETFLNCGNLKEVIIPRSITKFGENMFANCHKLKTIKYCGTKDEFKEISDFYCVCDGNVFDFDNIIYDYTNNLSELINSGLSIYEANKLIKLYS